MAKSDARKVADAYCAGLGLIGTSTQRDRIAKEIQHAITRAGYKLVKIKKGKRNAK